MKTTRKVLAITLCAILLVGASVMGTMAYLTGQTEEVKNTFTVGNVSFADKALDELDVDVYGKPTDGTTRDMANEYKLVPGHTYTKDPTVHLNPTSEPLWLFVEVNVADAVANVLESGENNDKTIAAQIAKNGWVKLEGTENIYTKEAAIEPSENNKDFVVFDTITVKQDADVSNVKTTDNITVKAYIVQADGFKTAAAAWAETFGKTPAQG